MSHNPDFEQRANEFLEKLQEQEREKEMLYDRSIGGELAPRPTVQFIEDCVGPMKSQETLHEEAREAAAKEIERSRIEAIRKAEIEQSLREHSQRVENQKSLDQDIDI